jgi:hypothetical protein
MCDAVAVGREHTPPLCFFPDGYRRNLVTVPSCDNHNSKNSKDVEYIRNVISTQHGTNEAGTQVFEAAKRSFDYRPSLFHRTFPELMPVQVDGSETGAFQVDLARHRNVMKAIAYALYFHDHGRKHRGDWEIFTPSFVYAGTIRTGQPDPWQNFRRLLESGKFTTMTVPEPEVFKYAVTKMEHHQLCYRFEFYGNVVVNAWTIFQTYVSWNRHTPPII